MSRGKAGLRYFAAVLVAAAAVLNAATPVQASLAIWQRQLDPMSSPTVLTHPDGSVSMGRGDSSNPYAIQTVDSSNTTVYRIPAGQTFRVSPYTYMWEVATDNTMYVPEYESVGQGVRVHLAAYRHGSLLWRMLPPDTCPNQLNNISALRLGVDGNIYVVHSRSTGCGGSEYFLTSFHPQTGAVLSRISLGNNFSMSAAGMFAYTEGIALLGGLPLRLRYYSYEGGMVSETIVPLNRGEQKGAHVGTHDGRVYITISRYRSSTPDCQWESETTRIIAVEPSGLVLDTYTVQPCAHTHPSVMPSGGLALIIKAYNLDDRLLVLDTNLNEVWDAAFDTGIIGEREFPNWLEHEMWVDNNGNIVTLTPYWRENQRYRGVQIALLDGANGARKSVFHTDQLNPDLSFAAQGGKIGLANGMLYVTAYVCSSYGCNSRNPYNLYAIPVAGLGMDYPRARILGQTPTDQAALEYVALGDSFSAGEGVEPFSPPTGTNGCHRSELAYARLLDANPWLNLRLQSFRACSGASTADVIHGRNGEPSQLEALGENTDIATITIGGNDIGFAEFAAACVDPLSDCEAGSASYNESMSRIQNELPAALHRLFTEIQGRIGSQTRVLVVGYPHLVLPGSSAFGTCAYLSAEEKATISAVTTMLNNTIQVVVGRAGPQFEFVNAAETLDGIPVSPFAGHELCREDSYFNGAMLPIEYSFHPNRKGQAAYEALVRGYLMRT